MKLIVECRPTQRLADLADVKLALLELGYRLTVTPAGDLLARHPDRAPLPSITPIKTGLSRLELVQ